MPVARSYLSSSSHEQSACAADLCKGMWVSQEAGKSRELAKCGRTFYHDIDSIVVFHI